MPLLKFHILRGRSEAEINALLDAAHEAVLEAFRVPERDRYQIVFEHDADMIRAQDTGLGIERTEKFVLLEVVSRPRAKEAKQLFYRLLCEKLQTACGIPTTDVMVSFVINGDDDWSFGGGRAQFLTGEL
jgi:hypothetical protein